MARRRSLQRTISLRRSVAHPVNIRARAWASVHTPRRAIFASPCSVLAAYHRLPQPAITSPCCRLPLWLLPQVPYLSKPSIETTFLSRAALALSNLTLSPREQIECGEALTIVTGGLVARHGRLGANVLGADMVLDLAALRDTMPAMTLTFVQAATLTRAALDTIISDFPFARAAVRHYRIRLTLQRVIMILAAKAHEHMKEESRTRVLVQPLSLQQAFERARVSFLPPSVMASAAATATAEKSLLEQMDGKINALGTSMDRRMDALAASVHELLSLQQRRQAATSQHHDHRHNHHSAREAAQQIWSSQQRYSNCRAGSEPLLASPTSPSRDRPPQQKPRRRHRHHNASQPDGGSPDSTSAAGSVQSSPILISPRPGRALDPPAVVPARHNVPTSSFPSSSPEATTTPNGALQSSVGSRSPLAVPGQGVPLDA